MPEGALLVRQEAANLQLRATAPIRQPETSMSSDGGTDPVVLGEPSPPRNRQPTGLFGSIEIDTVRPVKAFDSILNDVVMELQRTKGAKVKLTLEIEADAEDGFSDADIGVIRDNARQLCFKVDSTGFE
jgi:uncharacterized protein